MDNAEWKSNMQDIQKGAYKKKKRVSLASLSQSIIGQKRIDGLKN
jgi:hypothetical protein